MDHSPHHRHVVTRAPVLAGTRGRGANRSNRRLRTRARRGKIRYRTRRRARDDARRLVGDRSPVRDERLRTAALGRSRVRGAAFDQNRKSEAVDRLRRNRRRRTANEILDHHFRVSFTRRVTVDEQKEAAIHAVDPRRRRDRIPDLPA